MIFDGPFSDSLENREIIGLDKTEISKEQALEKVKTWFSDILQGGTPEYLGETKGNFAKECAIVAQADIHMTTEGAQKYSVRDGQRLSVRLETERPVVLENVIARVKDKSKSQLAMHIDFDKANAARVRPDTKAFITKRW